MSMLKSISVPDAVTHIGSYCFAEDTVMTSAKLSASLDTLSEGLLIPAKLSMGLSYPKRLLTLINMYLENASPCHQFESLLQPSIFSMAHSMGVRHWQILILLMIKVTSILA